MDANVVEELLFFDTFSHDASEEINLDLVQFPKPVIISEIRIIPLGARVQADFPGGVRLGATNPSQFHIEFFVNDLSKPGASNFESLGALEYRQTSDIQFQCGQKKIPTDGLVIRGWYTTITLALYGSLSKGIPPPPPDPRSGEISASAATAEWVQSQQATIYLDTGYNYPPTDFPPAAPGHQYADSWTPGPPPAGPILPCYGPVKCKSVQAYQQYDKYNRFVPNQSAFHYAHALRLTSVGTTKPLGINEPYDAPVKGYGSQNEWEAPPEGAKPWKEGLIKTASPIRTGSSGGDSGGKSSRHRGEYWDDRDDRKDRRRRDEDVKRFKDVGKERSPAWRDQENRSRLQKGPPGDLWDREREKSPHSETGSYRRRPKSPPPSPKRPYTPTERFWSPDRREYRSPSGRFGDERRRYSPPPPRPASPGKPRSTDQLRVDVYAGSPQTPLQSPGGMNRPPMDERNLEEEQFEPILSDEDILDEPDTQFTDLDYDVQDDLEDIVKPFNPFTYIIQPLQNFTDPAKTEFESLNQQSDPEALQQLEQCLTTQLDAKEEWISAAEQIPPLLFRALSSPSAVSGFKEPLLQWMEFGLDMDKALEHPAPGAKLRHIKAGIRLAESLCQTNLTGDLVRGGLQKRLLQLFHWEHMALSIRLLILQVLDITLLDPAGMDSFLTEQWELEVCGTTYKHILEMMAAKQQVRIKFALTSLLQKVHTVEVISRLAALTSLLIDGKEVEESELNSCLQAINRVYIHANQLFTQPRRFLPLQSQFEVRLESDTARLFLYRYFRKHGVLESLLVLLTSRMCGQPVVAAAYDFLHSLSGTQDGLLFLASAPPVTSSLLKALQAPEDFPEQVNSCPSALELPYRLFIINSLDKLQSLKDEGDVFSVLHELFCLSFTSVGKIQIAIVMSLENNVQILLKLLDMFDRTSAVRGYVGDLLLIAIKYSSNINYLRTEWRTIIDAANEDAHGSLMEVVPWIQPMEIPLEDISGLCEILKRHVNVEISGALPGELITCVRILQHLCVPPHSDLPCEVDCEDTSYKELRYKHAALQLYSLDGLAHVTSILTKVIDCYEQPYTHSARLVGSLGSNVVSFIEPAVVLMRVMLTHLIEARRSEYKDLTHVNVLIETYTLMQAIPSNAEAQNGAQNISRHIVETLLAYTQPSTQPDAYGKSLWSLMLSDVLKFIMKAPYCFIPGFSLLSELLPLPLPIQLKNPAPPEEVSAMRSARQLWSAHVHPLAGALHDLFAALAAGSFAPLLQLVRRVAVQLADLAAPTALILARAVIDPLLATLARPDGGWELPVTPHAARLLHFLACLVPHPAFKVAIMSLITPGANARTDERLLTLVDALTTILRTPGSSPSHAIAQEYVVLLMQTLIDPEVSLVPVGSKCLGLANALPARDLLSTMISAILDHAATPDNPLQTLLLSLKPLILLTDHDYGFYHLRAALEAGPDAVFSILLRLSSELSREHTEALNALHGTLALLREMLLDAPTPLRTLSMTAGELSRVVGWGSNNADAPHPLLQIYTSLKEWSSTDDALSNLCESAGDLVKLLSNCDPNAVSAVGKEGDFNLPPAMPLMEQFACRPLFVIGESEIKSLSSAYWLSVPPPDDGDQDVDQVSCDLLELSRALLPDLHLPQEVLRICRLKPLEEDEEGKKREPSKYQLSGIRSRRPFVAPMRGRGGRPAPQRGDLFRSRPPNTSRPPSLHVDDFVALETCGQQPTGPTGYNKVSVRNVKEVIATRARGRGRAFGASPYPRRDSPRAGGRGRGTWGHEDLRQQAGSRLRTWQTDDLRRIHPFPR